jgi:hypothetical protein
MRRTDQPFSPSEMKAAMWIFLATLVIAVGGMALKEMVSPSLGEYGAGDFASSSMPGVTDARPIAG